MSTNHFFSVTVMLVLFSTVALYAIDAYGDSNDSLDINLNSIYIKNRSQKNYGVLSESVIQFPYPISESAKRTGQGPFGGITYVDNKMLATTNTQLASIVGIGRIYYSSTIPGDTPQTFVPFVTFYRGLFVDYKDTLGVTHEGKIGTWLSPGVRFAYRFDGIDGKLVAHYDMEVYSYARMRNNRVRTGLSYMPHWPIIFSASLERVSWDLYQNISGSDFTMRGDTRELTGKIILRDPPNGNFSLILGYGALRNAEIPAFFEQGIDSKERFIGVEASAGVLAW